MSEKPTRREILLASGATAGALSGCLSTAQGQSDGCVPPGQYDCPDDYEYLAKLEFENCSFSQDEGDCGISITDYENKDGEECEPVAFDWEVDEGEDCMVYNIRVNGGGDCEDHEEDGAREGSVTTNLENRGGQRAAISNVIFCGESTPEDTPEDTPEQTPEETPTDKDGDKKEKDDSEESTC